ncbi:cytidine deaminase [Suhomyces tanzawaensis NRRL Y-17324]|uniref:Cytidine deaminase n=1 Tax=Suhomyces tanzawaensis NRRL Y-17324 TaxID=984487 RepID=A0A1E4SLZ2_9ASCO|nr:cytidine deaminase [Suhomyces tanzawaensis NRRL Y-17324]ODV80530.1 cytidine deaminase [Suhomyces tanzawaensis NRRL Y-17324]
MGFQQYIHNDHDELSDFGFSQLKEKCLNARNVSYSPYSNFRVGCTILTETGEHFSGANVENASYGAGVCAERTAICKAVTEGHRKFKIIAISGDDEEPITPCGICRQFIREFAPEVPIYMFNKDGSKFIKVFLQDLLPLSFGPENLGIKFLIQ